MFDHLTSRLSESINKLRGLGRLTPENIQTTLGEVRNALLEADVALPVAKDFIAQVQEKALGQKVIGNVRPGDAFVKVVQDELAHLLGDEQSELNLNAKSPIVILMAGLQGSGKTTSAAKLARFLKEDKKKSVMVTSADIYRPAAIKQLETLAAQIDVHFFPSDSQQKPTDIAKAAIKQAQTQFIDVLIIDTAGRLHIDDELMQEIRNLSAVAIPTEILLVVDSMMGQDAANMAKAFNDALAITGIVLTKTDGDARGGAALSMRMITQKPIKFIGIGEKIDALAPFHPNRMASRILGMGDIVSLVEEAQRKVDHAQAEKIAKKLKKGKSFDFDDFLGQIQQLKKMGGMQSLMSKLPGVSQLPKGTAGLMDDKLITKMEAIVYSMTHKERRFPALINGSRKRRIAEGSGNHIQDVNKLLKQFTQMQKMMKRMKGDKMMKRMKEMRGKIPSDLLGQFPPDWDK
jgi:signal recognition particle subunit SRP54